MAASLVGLGLFFFTGSAWSQAPSSPSVPVRPGEKTADGTITFFKEANSTVPVQKTSALIPSLSDTAAPAGLSSPMSVASSESPVPLLPPLPPPVPAVVAPSSLPAPALPPVDAAQPAVAPLPSFTRSTPASANRPTLSKAVTNARVPSTSVPIGTVTPPTTRQVARQMAPTKGAPLGARPYLGAAKEDDTEAEDQSPPPGPSALFKLESEAHWMERMRQDKRSKGDMERLVFPEEPPVSAEKYAGRDWKLQRLGVEPSYVCYGRLYFEDKNAERYGWDLGPLHPLLSTAKFWYDCAMLPYNAFSDPFNRVESNAGYCLPGDPVPLMLYPPKLSLTGFAGEAAAATAIPFVFP